MLLELFIFAIIKCAVSTAKKRKDAAYEIIKETSVYTVFHGRRLRIDGAD